VIPLSLVFFVGGPSARPGSDLLAGFVGLIPPHNFSSTDLFFLAPKEFSLPLFSVCVPFSPGQELVRPRFDFSGCSLTCLREACLRLKLPTGRSRSGPALVFSSAQATLIGGDLSLCLVLAVHLPSSFLSTL
jgi:hypothetical protein